MRAPMRVLPAIVAAVALWGCGEEAPPDPGAVDRDAYTRSAALLDSDPAAAGALCQQISDPVLEGECGTFAAKAMAKRKLDPLPLCEALRHSGWREVCLFESVDGAGLYGERAIQACQRTGGFRQRCLSHSLARETDRQWREVPLGKEAEFVTWIEAKMPEYGLDTSVENIPRDFLAKRIARRLSSTGQSGRFSRAACGSAPADTCTEVYRFRVRHLFRQQDMRALCAEPVTRERVEAAGLPGWEDDFADSAPEMWRRLCRELTGGGRPPRGQH